MHKVDLNNGTVAADIVKDVKSTTAAFNNQNYKNIGEERLRKNRKKDKDGAHSEGIHEKPEGSKEKPSNNNTNNKPAKTTTYPELNPKDILGTTKNVAVSHYVSWKEFWVQYDAYDELNQKLNDNKDVFKSIISNDEINPGEKCVIQEDANFYRCQINHVKDNDMVSVFCVDFGFTRAVNASNLLKGPKDLYEKPGLALRCKLEVKIPYLDKIVDKSGGILRVKFKNHYRNTYVLKLEKEKQEKREKKGGNEEGGLTSSGEVSVTYLETVSKIWFVSGDHVL